MVVVVVVFAEAPFRHARFPFLLFAVFVAINFDEEEEEEEEEHVEEDDDLIGIFDPVTSAILYILFPYSLFSLLKENSKSDKRKRSSLERAKLRERYFVFVV